MGASPQSDWYADAIKHGAVPVSPQQARKYSAIPVQPPQQNDWYADAINYGAVRVQPPQEAQAQAAAQPAAPPPSLGDRAVNALVAGIPGINALELTPEGQGVLRGLGKGALQTVGSVSKLINKLPVVGERLAPQAGINALEQLSTPQTTPEKIGAGAEQGVEGLVLGALAPEAIPFEGAAGTLANIAAQGGVGALSNAAHGGSPLAGAAVGAGGEGLLQAMRAGAPGIVNSALGFGAKSKEFGRNPGQVILDETKGIRPNTLLPEVRKQIDARTAALDAMAAANPNIKVSLEPVQQHILNLMEGLQKENVDDFDPYLEKLWDHVTFDKRAKMPFPSEVSGEQAVDLKRGLGKYVPRNSWREGAGGPMPVLAKQAQYVLGDTINRAIPGAEEQNRLISNLIEAEKRLKVTTKSMGPGERLIDRFTRPTGALAGAILGGEWAGAPGAIATIAAQEALRSPTLRMLAARSMYAAPRIGAPIVRGAGLPLAALATKKQPER
jgi:hypothetical protein